MKKQFKSLYPTPLGIADATGRPVDYCGIRCSLEVLGGKWKLLILSKLFAQPLRYSGLKKAIPEISEKMLVASLQELEYHGIVARTVSEGRPASVDYSLTAYGQQVRPVLEVLYQWGENHIAQHHSLLFR